MFGRSNGDGVTAGAIIPSRADFIPKRTPHSNMDEAPAELTDITIHGPRTRLRGVTGMNVESRPWLAGFPVCKALNQYQIIHVGFQTAYAPTRVVRTKQTTTYFLACIGGRGRVLIDGHWRICKDGFACLL